MDKFTYANYLKELHALQLHDTLLNIANFLLAAAVLALVYVIFNFKESNKKRALYSIFIGFVSVIALHLFIVNSPSKLTTNQIQKNYMEHAKVVATTQTIELFPLSKSNENVAVNVDGKYLYVKEEQDAKNDKTYIYTGQENFLFGIYDLKEQYKVSSDKQIHIQETDKKPTLVVVTYRFQDKRFDDILHDYKLPSFFSFLRRGESVFDLMAYNPHPQTFTFNIPKGGVLEAK